MYGYNAMMGRTCVCDDVHTGDYRIYRKLRLALFISLVFLNVWNNSMQKSPVEEKTKEKKYPWEDRLWNLKLYIFVTFIYYISSSTAMLLPRFSSSVIQLQPDENTWIWSQEKTFRSKQLDFSLELGGDLFHSQFITNTVKPETENKDTDKCIYFLNAGCGIHKNLIIDKIWLLS